jgi:hypothetical protein
MLVFAGDPHAVVANTIDKVESDKIHFIGASLILLRERIPPLPWLCPGPMAFCPNAVARYFLSLNFNKRRRISAAFRQGVRKISLPDKLTLFKLF